VKLIEVEEKEPAESLGCVIYIAYGLDWRLYKQQALSKNKILLELHAEIAMENLEEYITLLEDERERIEITIKIGFQQ
jgi:hypothetical protein